MMGRGMGGMGGRGSRYGNPNPRVEAELKKPKRGILIRLGKYLWQFKWLLLIAFGLTIGRRLPVFVSPAPKRMIPCRML